MLTSLVPLELPFAPVGIFALGIEHPLDMTVQRLHDRDPRQHRRTASRHLSAGDALVGTSTGSRGSGLGLRRQGMAHDKRRKSRVANYQSLGDWHGSELLYVVMC